LKTTRTRSDAAESRDAPVVVDAAGAAVVRGLIALTAPVTASPALAFGVDAGVLEALSAERGGAPVEAPASTDALGSGYTFILAGDGVTQGGVAATAARIDRLAQALAPDGVLAVWLASLAAPLPGAGVAAYEALLFPEAAGAGELGEAAQSAVLSVSSWLMLMRRAGLELVNQAGVGEAVLPAAVVEAHGVRLAALDEQELATGRFLAVFRHGAAA
jgi:hypothetical protein